MSPKKVRLSLVLPCYNEAEHITSSVPRILKVLNSLEESFEVIFIDDASKDLTRELLTEIVKRNKKKNLRLIFQSHNFGRGYAVTTGIKAAKGDMVGYLDIDLEVAPDYVPETLQKLDFGYDVVCGWRIYDFELASISRWLASSVYRFLTQVIFQHSLHDTEAGYKFFRRNAALKLIKKTQDHHWFWDTEVMVYARRTGMSIFEQKVRFIRRSDKTSTVQLAEDSLEYLKRLVQFRLRLLTKK